MNTRDPEINRRFSKLRQVIRLLDSKGIRYAISGRMRDFILGSPVFPDEIEIYLEREMELGNPFRVMTGEFEHEDREFFGMKVKIKK